MLRSSRMKASLVAVFAVALLASSSGYRTASAHQVDRSGAALNLVHPGHLTVGSDTTYPPMENRDASGQFVGADIGLARALAHAMGLKGAIIVDNSFDSIIPALTTRHEFDVIMSSMNDTPDRRKVISFVDYMTSSESLVVKASSSIHANGYGGMCGRTVAVESGTTELFGLQAANKTCGNKINIKTFTKDTDAYQAFASGHAEAYSGDLPVGALYVKNSHGGLRLAGRPFNSGQNYGIGLSKHAMALHQALIRGLRKIRHNGQYRRILNRWGVGGAAI